MADDYCRICVDSRGPDAIMTGLTIGYRPRCLVELGQDGEGTTVLNVTIAGLPAGDGVEFLGFLGECFSNMEAAGGEDR